MNSFVKKFSGGYIPTIEGTPVLVVSGIATAPRGSVQHFLFRIPKDVDTAQPGEMIEEGFVSFRPAEFEQLEIAPEEILLDLIQRNSEHVIQRLSWERDPEVGRALLGGILYPDDRVLLRLALHGDQTFLPYLQENAVHQDLRSELARLEGISRLRVANPRDWR